jgi:ABC-type transport system involved in multi-copper enzyme maturation permease subunit
MRKVFLIAINHLRDQRWILLTMFGYVLFMSTVMGVIVHRPNYQDASFFVEQQMWFSVLFSMFLATSAVNTDMRTRRMQAILSKAVERWQYLLGILVGITMAITSYCIVVGVLGLILSNRAGHALSGIFQLGGCVLIVALAVESVGLFFGLLLPPIFATTATVGFLTTVPLLTIRGPSWLNHFGPVAWLATQTVQQFNTGHAPQIRNTIIENMVYSAIVFCLALAVFNRRDLARATE